MVRVVGVMIALNPQRRGYQKIKGEANEVRTDLQM